jgi:hypothetical protein
MYDTWALVLCMPDCSGPMGSAECPAPWSGDAVPACREVDAGDWNCVLDCEGATCPDGMSCAPSTIGSFCFW